MIIKKKKDFDPQIKEDEEMKGVKFYPMLTAGDGTTNFAMRLFEIEPGGYTPRHQHEWEHEVYVIQGKGAVKQKDKEYPVQKGSFILVKPNEEHQFINKGMRSFRFICIVPLMKKD